ncbi:MAG TPA: gluconate 2-dehydrogenase subunit 3 family protein, partial [Anaerolineales bacterium]|nr:gluconate 2-dehydrogenase subunit 3 family protein [Anaerolineales bacterium]
MKRLEVAKQKNQSESLDVPLGGGAEETPYPEFNITDSDKWNLDWDEKTRRLVIDRVKNVPSYRFFSPEEARLLEAICDCALPQDDRPKVQGVPIAPWIDERLYTDEGSGYRYENMPEDRQAYRMGLQGFDETAHH